MREGRTGGLEEGWKYVGREGEVLRGCFEGGRRQGSIGVLKREETGTAWEKKKSLYDKTGFKRNRLQHPFLFSGFDVFSTITALRLFEDQFSYKNQA